MDFNFSEEQLAVSEAATGVFSGLVDPERIGIVEQTEDRIDHALWQALADADLLGLAVPESEGGAGQGLMELCLLLEAQGNAVAPVPLWATLVLGALPIAHFGSEAQRSRWLPGVVSGDVILTASLTGSAASPTSSPAVRATAQGEGWVLDGTELAVPQAHLADRIVVPAHTEGGDVVLVLVDPGAPGVSLERAVTTNREVHPHLHLAGVTVGAEDVLVGADLGRATLAFLSVAAIITLCALQVGVCEAALTQTAAYLNGRHQFGRPLSTFQGTMLRAADAAIDIEAMRVTWQNAAWRFDSGRDAADAARVAKWQAAERGQRTVHATQHLHGGMGADITYPIHRYFLWGKQIELLLGGPERAAGPAGRGHRRAGPGGGGGGGVTAPPVSGPTYADVAVGDELPTLVLPVTRTLIVSGAIASRDYQDVHHDSVLAQGRGSKDIFMNILTTNGLVGRYVTDWSGPRGRLSEVNIRLGAPNYPDCTMTLTGSVTAKGALADDGRSGVVTVTIRGANHLGDHVTGTVSVVLPLGDESSNGGG